MSINRKSTCAFVSLNIFLGLALVGAAGCSNDNASDSTPAVFTPTAATAKQPAQFTLVSAGEPLPMPAGGTLYLIDAKMDLSSRKDADFLKNDIISCLVTVTYSGQEMVSDSSLVDAQGVSPCRAGDKADEVGTFMVATAKKSGGLTFSIKMYDIDHKVTVQGSTASLAVQPGGIVTQDLVATPLP